mgnify:CR=1 FL=1
MSNSIAQEKIVLAQAKGVLLKKILRKMEQLQDESIHYIEEHTEVNPELTHNNRRSIPNEKVLYYCYCRIAWE